MIFSLRAMTMSVVFVLLTLLLFAHSVENRGIVRRSGIRFVDADCREVMYSGWNSWQLMEAAAGVTDDSLEWILDTMRNSGLTVGRFFGHGNSYATLVLQTSPGQYNEMSLQALDKVLAAAADRGLRVVLTLTDNWTEADSKKQYAQWADKDPDEFYTDFEIKGWFKQHVQFLATRVNSINGRVYREDPVIFSWNLMNEPRCECYQRQCSPSCRDRMQSWIDEMANFLKSVDPYHMVTVGEEGFFSYESGHHDKNPDAQKGHDWAVQSGQDFHSNHASPAIDYGAVHCWPDNWGDLSIDFQNQWLNEHISACKSLGKPMILEEFGKSTQSFDTEEIESVKNPYFQNAFDIFNADCQEGVFKGIGFWEFGNLLPYGVETNHSTWNEIIVPQSQSLNDIIFSRYTLGNCQPGDQRSMDVLSFDGVSYISPGINLILQDSKQQISETFTVAILDECILECNRRSDSCSGIQFSSELSSCRILSSASSMMNGRLIWSVDGWQQYMKRM